MLARAASSSPEFSAATVEQLSHALRAYLWSGDDAGHDDLRLALARLCAEAHAAKLGPERMLVAVKSVWARLPDIERVDVERARVTLESVVGHCIEAYYGASDAAHAGFADKRQEPRIV